MSTSTDTDTLAEHEAAIEALYDKLASVGVVYATADWYGGGDEGSVQQTDYFGPPADDGTQTEMDVPADLDKEVAEAVDEYVMALYGGWYNEDGGAGQAQIEVLERKTTIKHAWTDTHDEPVMPHVVGYTPTPLEVAQYHLTEAAARQWTATQQTDQAEARYCALVLLQLADEYPAGVVTGITWEEDWNSDDEGGFFSSPSVWVESDSTVPGYYEAIAEKGEPNDSDDLYQFSSGALALLGEENKTISLDVLRKHAGVE